MEENTASMLLGIANTGNTVLHFPKSSANTFAIHFHYKNIAYIATFSNKNMMSC